MEKACFLKVHVEDMLISPVDGTRECWDPPLPYWSESFPQDRTDAVDIPGGGGTGLVSFLPHGWRG